MSVAGPSTPTRRAGGRVTRREDVLAAALTAFAEEGFDATSVRDIAERCGMLSGSLYYHFPSKDELYAHLHEEAVAALKTKVSAAADEASEPWDRLSRAATTHLEAILKRDEQALLVMTPLGPGLERVRERIVAQRDSYEDLFRGLVAAVDLAPGIDRAMFRLHFVGALNWTHVWYRPGRLEPAAIAEQILGIVARCRP